MGIVPKNVLKKITKVANGANYMVEHGNEMIDEIIEDVFDIAYYELDEKFSKCIDKCRCEHRRAKRWCRRYRYVCNSLGCEL